MADHSHQFNPTHEDFARVRAALSRTGDRDTVYYGRDILPILLTEHQLKLADASNRRMLYATVALVVTTMALVIVTAIYIGAA